MKNLKNRKGFTFVEMLCAVLLLVLVSFLIVSGMQFAMRSYNKSLSFSEAQILCDTLTTAISDELRYSENAHKDSADLIEKFNSQGYGDDFFFVVKDGKVYLRTFDIYEREYVDYKIISDSTYTNGNVVKKLNVVFDYDKEIFIVDLVIANGYGDEVRSNHFEVVQISNIDYLTISKSETATDLAV